MSRPSRLTALIDFTLPGNTHPLRPVSVRNCPAGVGPILVVPGLLGSDRQTRQFRDCLQMLGYTPAGWELGVNVGPTPTLLERFGARVVAVAKQHGFVRVVGFGMGGVFARWAAESRAAAVSGVATVSTPFREPYDTAWRAARMLVRPSEGLDTRALSFMIRQPPTRDWIALYTRNDRVVPWQSCMDPAEPSHCVEVTARHATCMRDEMVFRAIASWLGRPNSEPR